MVKLYNGNCLNILKAMADNSIDVAFTSPPYNRKRNDKYSEYEDTIDDYFSFLCEFTDELIRVCSKYVIINIQPNFYNREEVYRYIGKYSKSIQNIFTWEKSNPLPASGNNITNAFEWFIIFGKMPLKSNFTYTKNHLTTSVNMNVNKDHKAIMNLDVAKWFIERFTQGGETVIDPFMGLGTTGIACKNLNRKFVGIELVKKYYDQAANNIELAIYSVNKDESKEELW